MKRIVDLPSRGKLLVCTDLQGNLSDFLRIESVFESHLSIAKDTHLVITGDLVHGPELFPDEWPDHLGTYYHASSSSVLEQALDLQQRHPGKVTYLLGNHEHSHLGGPVVSKFFRNEAQRLEELLGPKRTKEARAWMSEWPLLAIAPSAQLCLLHAAPYSAINSRSDLDNISLDSLKNLPGGARLLDTLLGPILWARSTTKDRASAFLKALHPNLKAAIHGHDVTRQGFVVKSEEHICVSSSFGCFDGDKLYVEWDLSEPVLSAWDVAQRGLRRLWPLAKPVNLDPSLRRQPPLSLATT